MDNLLTAPNKTHVALVVPGILQGWGFCVSSNSTGASLRFNFLLDSDDQSSADILNFNTSYSYASATYHHIAVSYDGITYRCFINGSLVTSAVSQLKVVNGSHFIFGRHPTNQYHLDGKIDDFAYVPYCKYTANFTPPATALLASMPEQYVFDTKKMQMYKGYPTAFVAENTVFIGEALTSALNVAKAVTYALNGEYEERFSSDNLPAVAYAFFRAHNIGLRNVTGNAYALVLSGSSIGASQFLVDLVGHYRQSSPPFIDKPLPCLGILNGKLYFITLAYYEGAQPQLGYTVGGGDFTTLSSANANMADIVIKLRRSF